MNQYDDKVWDAVKILWMSGSSAYSIARKQGMPSREAICQKIKADGWERPDEHDDALDMVEFEQFSLTQQAVIKAVARGLPQRWAAARAGVTESTVSDWKRDPDFAKALQAAISVLAESQIRKVTDAEDWRSGMAMLERHPELRKEFAPPVHSPNPLVSLNVLGAVQVGIDRVETKTIEQQPALLESA